MASRHDYVNGRRLYVEGVALTNGARTWPSQNEVAKQIGANPTRLREFAARHKWTAARRKFQADLAAATSAALVKPLAGQAAEIDKRYLDMATALFGIVVRLVNELNKPDAQGKPHAPPTDQLLRLTQAVRNIQVIAKVATGDWRGEPPSEGALVVRIVRDAPAPPDHNADL